MTRLNRHIATLLREHDCVIVPRVGGFIAYQDPASYSYKQRQYLPPVRSVRFNDKLTLNDGLLAQAYMKSCRVSFVRAMRMLEKDAAVMSDELRSKEGICIHTVGTLRTDVYGRTAFTDHAVAAHSVELYGLKPLPIRPLAELEAQQAKVRTQQRVSPQVKQHKPARRVSMVVTAMQRVAAVLVGALFLLTLTTPVLEQEGLSGETASFASYHTGGRLSAEEQAANVKRLDRLFGSLDKQLLQEELKQAKADAVAPEEVTPVEEVGVVEATPAPEQPTPTAEMVTDGSAQPFHIIVASGLSMEKSKALAAELRDKGYVEASVIRRDGKVRVRIAAFDDKQEANNQLLKLREQPAYETAWLLVVH